MEGGALKVLIVEDSPEVQCRLIEMLQVRTDVQVVGCVDNAAEAINLADAQCPDVVVLDVALRGTDRGYTVLRHMRQYCPQSKTIVLSNFDWDEMREGFLRGGACAYFDKSLEFRKARDWVFEQAACKARENGQPAVPA
ncbi:MAG: response regulator transcription factor [Aquincola sp.]|nr:response regulator transcription factor [Aquincola sp.]MDH4287957.1 response regulator transcription factor [Aquincola sp.]MDH5328944.1 response regulator transcription factor [Aquincola sp.]